MNNLKNYNMEEKKMQYLFGMHPVLEAVKAGKKFDKVLLKQGLEGVQFRELMELLKENEIPFQFVHLTVPTLPSYSQALSYSPDRHA